MPLKDITPIIVTVNISSNVRALETHDLQQVLNFRKIAPTDFQRQRNNEARKGIKHDNHL